jgi:hypothetical protein
VSSVLVVVGSLIACLCAYKGGGWAIVSWIAGSVYGALATGMVLLK